MTTKSERVNVNIPREPYHRVLRYVSVDLGVPVGQVIVLLMEGDRRAVRAIRKRLEGEP